MSARAKRAETIAMRAYFGLSVSLLALAGCAVGPEYRASSAGDLGVPEHYSRATANATADDLTLWWDRFDDPVLVRLVEQSFESNQDIAQAAARFRQAREGLVQARSSQLPSITTSGSVGRNINGERPDTTSFSNGIDAQWSADLAGGLRRGSQVARASLEAAGYSLANVRTAIAAELARNYIDARTLNTRLTIAHDTLATQDDNLEIAGFRAQAGLVSSLDVEQARSQRAATAALIPSLQQAEAAARNRIAVLVGQAPGAVDTLFAGQAPIPATPASLTIGIPADVLRQRPDVRAAERNLAAATAQIGVAQAQLYPALTLSGNLGSSATSLRTLTDVITGGVFASLARTMFDGGRLRSVVRQRRAQAEESFAAYKGSVLGALEDVENALAARDAAEGRSRALNEQVKAANAAAILARSNYRAGLSDFRTLLDAERTLLSARDSLASAQGDRATAMIQLYLALGGGWSPPAALS